MNDTPEQPVESIYKPEEGEVRPVSRYSIQAAPPPGGLEELARETVQTPYQSLSGLSIAAIVLAVGYSFFVALGGIAAFWFNASWVLIFGTILVPLLSIPVALRFNIREPLGLLRFAALALAGFYAVPIGVGGLIAFPSSSPWLMPLWTLIIPLAAVGLGLAARLRIQASEETLSGKLLATWAVGLSGFFALCYLAFYTATYFAVRQQGAQFANSWIERLQKNDVERAFAMTIPPALRGGAEDVSRDTLETSYNSQRGPEGVGEFTGFGQMASVRLLRGSTKPNVELVGVRDWGYENGGYKVLLNYRVSTPYWSFPLDLAVHGLESQKGDYKGRRWYVMKDASNLARFQPELTADGKTLIEKLYPLGLTFADGWTKILWNNEFQAMNDVGPLADFAKKLPVRVAAATVGGGLGMRAVQLKQDEPWFKGELVVSDKETFWAPTSYRKEVIEEVKKMFAPGGKKPEALRFRDLGHSPWPAWSDQDGQLSFRYDVEMMLTDVPMMVETIDGRKPNMINTPDGPKPERDKVHVEGRLVVSCPAAALTGGPLNWRIESLELVRARRPEEVKGSLNPARGPGGPAGARPGP